MDITPEKKKKLTKWIIGIAAACIVIYLGLQNMGTVAGALSWCIGLIRPLVLGVAIAVILNVPMRSMESHLWKKTKKPFCKSCAVQSAFCWRWFLRSILGSCHPRRAVYARYVDLWFSVCTDGGRTRRCYRSYSRCWWLYRSCRGSIYDLDD